MRRLLYSVGPIEGSIWRKSPFINKQKKVNFHANNAHPHTAYPPSKKKKKEIEENVVRFHFSSIDTKRLFKLLFWSFLHCFLLIINTWKHLKLFKDEREILTLCS